MYEDLSEDPPNVEAARRELGDGLAHAFQQLWREDKRPEAWLVSHLRLMLDAQLEPGNRTARCTRALA